MSTQFIKPLLAIRPSKPLKWDNCVKFPPVCFLHWVFSDKLRSGEQDALMHVQPFPSKIFKDFTLSSTFLTHKEGRKVNEAEDVDNDVSIRMLLIRHQLLTYVCSADSSNNNGCHTGEVTGPSLSRMYSTCLVCTFFLKRCVSRTWGTLIRYKPAQKVSVVMDCLNLHTLWLA